MYPRIDKEKTGLHIRELMEQQGITVKQVQECLMLGSVQSIYHWLGGLSLPSVDNLYALSTLLKVSMDELICGDCQDQFDRNQHTSNDDSDLIMDIELNTRSSKRYQCDVQRERLQIYYCKIKDMNVA